MTESNQSYLERRLAEERRAAQSARDAAVKAIHAELARHYERRLAGPEGEGASPSLSR